MARITLPQIARGVSAICLAFLLSAVFWATPVLARDHECTTRPAAIAHLEAKYGERSIAIGTAGNGSIVETLKRPDNATWTIIVTTPQGKTCLVAAGTDWRQIGRKVRK